MQSMSRQEKQANFGNTIALVRSLFDVVEPHVCAFPRRSGENVTPIGFMFKARTRRKMRHRCN